MTVDLLLSRCLFSQFQCEFTGYFSTRQRHLLASSWFLCGAHFVFNRWCTTMIRNLIDYLLFFFLDDWPPLVRLKLFRCFQFPRQVIIYKKHLIYYWEKKEKILYHNVLITDWIGSMSGAVNGLSEIGRDVHEFDFDLDFDFDVILGNKQCGNSANTQVLATAPLITRWLARMIYELWK